MKLNTIMIKIFTGLIILLFFSPNIYPQQYWLTQTSPTTEHLNACFFTDSLKGWICGDSGTMIHTTNKGQTWIIQNTQTNDEIVAMYFITERYGFALGWEIDFTPPNYYGTRILRTTNGGNNWSNYLFQDTNLFLSTIYFLDSLNGYMAGSEGKILYTTNSGVQWIESTIDSSTIFEFPVEKIKFYNNQLGFAVGGAFDIAGMIWKTTNGGRNWRTQIVGPEPVHDLYIFDSINAIGVGGDYEYGCSNVKTNDAGSSWTYTKFGIFGIANTIGFRTDSEAWISLGIVDSFLVTTDGGANWRISPAPNGAKIYDLTFTDERNGWAVGRDGVILKYNSSLINIINNDVAMKSNMLYQNYPNPFNPNTVINYQLSTFSDVKLKVYDVLGKEIITLVDAKQNEGNYKVTFDGSNLQSGIYLVKLLVSANSLTKTLEYQEAKKMLLLK